MKKEVIIIIAVLAVIYLLNKTSKKDFPKTTASF